MIRLLNGKDESKFLDYFSNIRIPYRSLYLGDKNLKEIPECRKIFNDCLKRKSVAVVFENKEEFNGVLLIYFIDGKKNLKVYGHNRDIYRHLIKYLLWNKPTDLHFKLHYRDPNFKIACKCGFESFSQLDKGYHMIRPKFYKYKNKEN